jgi:hypothetical protein
MVVTYPYASKAVVKQYIRKVRIDESRIDDIIGRADVEINSQFHMGTAGFDDTYDYRKKINDLAEVWSACRLHMMFGDPADAKIYCEAYKSGLESLKEDITNISIMGKVKAILPETYPGNPFGHRLEGKSRIGQIPEWMESPF